MYCSRIFFSIRGYAYKYFYRLLLFLFLYIYSYDIIDLYALTYKWERTRARINHRNIINPKRFELNINYRSHNGILRLASSVIDLIWHFFPNSIDRLPPERSKVGGPQPIFFDGFKKEHLSDCKRRELDDVYTLNKQRRVDGDENPFVEFGADQVIIVRDEKAKMHVNKLINKVGLVMTVFEAKGMEFNDVLLYNFFTDSPACRKVILYRIYRFRSSYR
jgi:hypothetical protein